MALLQEIVRTQQEQIRISQNNNRQMVGIGSNEAYASYFPSWEVTAPQYVQPNAYTMTGFYRTNEVAYACIDLRMKTISEPPARVWDRKNERFLDDHPFYEFMQEPCPNLSETDFHTATEMFLQIAGGLSWEKEYANNGSLLHVWPMMPQYCSYMRGEGMLLRAIRYQPYTGLPYLDIPMEKVLAIYYPDPLYYGLKPLSPTMVLQDILKVDNDMTHLIQQFISNGAFVSGILSTDQILTAEDARFAKERFRESHGGPSNAGDVMVQGKGIKFETINNTFREMVFPELDARSESRICMAYGVKPILVSAKIGMDRSTMNNYKEARQAWYEENVTSEWKFIAERLTRDLLREFDDDPSHVIKFDTQDVKALQEDRTAKWTRAIDAYKNRVVVRNEALKEMGLAPLTNDLGNEYFATAMIQTSTSIQDDLDKPNVQEAPKTDQEVTGQDLVKVTPPTDEQKQTERKNFRAFAKRRKKEGKHADIPEYEFLYVDEVEQRQLLSEFNVPDPDAALVLEGLKALLDRLPITQPTYRPPNITLNVEPGKPAEVKVENILPEQKDIQLPAPAVTVNVEPTPVTVKNNVEVKTPKRARERQKVIRDGGNNIQGTVTEVEYDE